MVALDPPNVRRCAPDGPVDDVSASLIPSLSTRFVSCAYVPTTVGIKSTLGKLGAGKLWHELVREREDAPLAADPLDRRDPWLDMELLLFRRYWVRASDLGNRCNRRLLVTADESERYAPCDGSALLPALRTGCRAFGIDCEA